MVLIFCSFTTYSCFGRETGDVESVKNECAKCGALTWNVACCGCCCCACCGLCWIRSKKDTVAPRPLKPVVIRRDIELDALADVEKKRHKYKPRAVVFRNEKEEWMHSHFGRKKTANRCSIQ